LKALTINGRSDRHGKDKNYLKNRAAETTEMKIEAPKSLQINFPGN
jgi:hypothetical protein